MDWNRRSRMNRRSVIGRVWRNPIPTPTPRPLLTEYPNRNQNRNRSQHSRQDNHDRERSRSRSRSPIRFRNSASPDYDDHPRQNSRRAHSHSPSTFTNRSFSLELPIRMLSPPTIPALMGMGNVQNLELELRQLSLSTVNQVPTFSNGEPIARPVLPLANIEIPRRPDEGVMPIFERDELRESLQRRARAVSEVPSGPKMRSADLFRATHNGKFGDVCYNCKHFGHLKRNCPDLEFKSEVKDSFWLPSPTHKVCKLCGRPVAEGQLCLCPQFR